ncbi:hypothetical protein PM082_002884 [Marasmius tenuissimus]|nr:hypothetical protein PM082_002884 [Marasmius tenuissimus]
MSSWKGKSVRVLMLHQPRSHSPSGELEALLHEKDLSIGSSGSGPNHSDAHASGSASDSPNTVDFSLGATPTMPLRSSNNPLDTMFFSNWPPHLPEPALLHYLVELLFLYHPHTSQLLHKPTFMASLVLPPDHPKFPATPVLHAICALASAYTGIVTSAPAVDYTKVPLRELFTQKYRRDKESETSFADQQAQLAKETAQQLEVVGADLLQVVQGLLVHYLYTFVLNDASPSQRPAGLVLLL